MSSPVDAARARSCPICGQPAAEQHMPFCSARCADIDLGRWLGGRYAIPIAGEDGADAEATRNEARLPDDRASHGARPSRKGQSSA